MAQQTICPQSGQHAARVCVGNAQAQLSACAFLVSILPYAVRLSASFALHWIGLTAQDILRKQMCAAGRRITL